MGLSDRTHLVSATAPETEEASFAKSVFSRIQICFLEIQNTLVV